VFLKKKKNKQINNYFPTYCGVVVGAPIPTATATPTPYGYHSFYYNLLFIKLTIM
jgi:hypothetical protein